MMSTKKKKRERFVNLMDLVKTSASHLIGVALAVLLWETTAFATSASVSLCIQGCISGTDTATFTVQPSQVGVNLSGFTVSPGIEGPGTTDVFSPSGVTLFANGTASGFASGIVDPEAVSMFGTPGAEELLPNSAVSDGCCLNWSFSGSPGNETLTIVGTGGFCDFLCLGTTAGLPIPTSGEVGGSIIPDSSLTITAASIPTPVPEPASLLLLGSGLLSLGGWARWRQMA